MGQDTIGLGSLFDIAYTTAKKAVKNVKKVMKKETAAVTRKKKKPS